MHMTKNTILIFTLLYLMIFNTTNYSSQTVVSGGVVSGTWTKVNSPYLIQGAIMIANGTTLTIQPGVKVEFQGTYKFLVLGQLHAVGMVNDTINFTSADTTNGWLGIRFDSTLVTNDTSRFSFCKFKYGKANGTSFIENGGAIYLKDFSKVSISNSLISNCFANNWGGGIYCKNSSPLIYNNKIINNSTAVYGGGGIYFENSDPIIKNNVFSNNVVLATGRGSGVCCYGSNNGVISNNVFSNNLSFRGGGVFCAGGTPSISNNYFSKNKATADGSAIECEYSNAVVSNNTFSNNIGNTIGCEGSSPTVSNNVISNNNGIGIRCFINNGSNTPNIYNNVINNNTGTGITCSLSTPNIFNNIISNNNNGGISFTNSSCQISNNVIANNTSPSNGGGIYCSASSPTITNNTIANNQANKGGALYCTSSSNPIIKNTILWGDSAIFGNQVYLDDQASKPNIFYCNIQGGSNAFGLNTNVFYLGTYSNNMNSNPLFNSSSNGAGSGFNGTIADWSLQSNSPCIDAGNPNGIYPSLDIINNPRVANSIIDIGAFEFQNNVGIQNLDFSKKIKNYPNPFFYETIFKTDIPLTNASLIIYDCFGKIVDEIKNISGQSFTFYRKNLTVGTYIYKIVDENEKMTIGKLIISN
ncbi:MAG: right-handed parallel beta-helix repeat-containing protein [Bacteroidia bacterium]